MGKNITTPTHNHLRVLLLKELRTISFNVDSQVPRISADRANNNKGSQPFKAPRAINKILVAE